MINRFIGICLAFGLTGCSLFSSEDATHAVAKVGDVYLLDQELTGVSYPGQPEADSAAAVQQFIDDWIKQRLVVEKAELNLAKSVDIEQRVAAYREQLLVHHYQQALIDQKLDTLITTQEYQTYYDDHAADFVLQHAVYRLRFVLVQDNTPNIDSFEVKLDLLNKEESPGLKEDCFQYAISCELDSAKWVSGSIIDSELGTGEGALVKYPKRKIISLPLAQGRVAFFEIFDTRQSGDPAPLGYVKPRIRSTILETRKKDLLKNMRDELYKRAFSRGHAEIL